MKRLLAVTLLAAAVAPLVAQDTASSTIRVARIIDGRGGYINGNLVVSVKDGKIAITTSSEEARKEFLAGRDLSEKLRLTDSIAHFDKAISLDPNFAYAELLRAQVSPTAKEFFDHLNKIH